MLLLRGDAGENLKRVKAFNMEPLTLGYMKRPDSKPEEVIGKLIEDAHLLGVNRVTVFSGSACSYRFKGRPDAPTYDEIMSETEEFESVARALAKEDIVFAFHNHDIEFTMSMRGVPVMYLMLANSEYMKVLLDVGWVQYAGRSPGQVIRELGDRVAALHIKDMTTDTVEQERKFGKVDMPQFTTPGTGILDLKECLKAGAEIGLEWAIVEQDFQNKLNFKETLTAAYLNMKETGYLE
jgi:sugar phosphate isomerase/epimerase